MNRQQVVDVLLKTADTISYGEAPVVDLSEFTPAELDEFRSRLHPIAQAVRHLQALTLSSLIPHLGSRGFVRFEGRTYRAAPERTIRVRREVEAEFFDLVEKSGLTRQLFNPNYARMSGLRRLAEKWVDTETGEVGWEPFAEQFLDITEGEVKVSELPADRAPQFIQKAEDGEVVKRG